MFSEMASLSEVLRRKQAHRSQQKDHKVINDLAETKIRLRKLQELEVMNTPSPTSEFPIILGE
jgi:hypothetical protein